MFGKDQEKEAKKQAEEAKKQAEEAKKQAEESFKEGEQERLEESGVTHISTNRGTSKIPVEDTVTEKRKEYDGKKSTNRGTSSE